MKKSFIIFLCSLLLILCIAGYGWYLYNKPRVAIESEQIEIQIQSRTLFREYTNNESTANDKYLNKILEVSGKVISIDDTNNNFIVALEGGTDGNINCAMGAKNAKITKGQTVKIKGRCTGFLMDVNLVDCILVQ